MALVPCKSCKYEVDKRAKVCPGCGVANPGVTRRDKVFGLLVLLGLIVAVVAMCSSNPSETASGPTSNTPPAPPAQSYEPSQFASVSEMMADFNDYTAETGQFEVVTEDPLHIHLRPGVVEGDLESVIQAELKRAVIYGIYKTLVHTSADQVWVTASPMMMTFNPVTLTAADSPIYDVSLSRQQALAAVAAFFPVDDIRELVTLQGGSTFTYEAWSPEFQQLYYEDQTPGLNAFFDELSKKPEQ